MDVVIFLLSLPLWLLTVWPLVAGARRVLGVRVSTPRALLGAAGGWLVSSSIIFATVPAMRTSGQALALGVPIAGVALVVTLVTLFIVELIRPSDKGWGVLGWAGALRRRVNRTRRYLQIVRIAFRNGLGPYARGRPVDQAGSAQREARLARSLRRTLEDGGVVFVKLGQVLSTRPDLLSPVFLDELSRLQHQATPVERDQIEEVLRAELDSTTGELVDIDPVPLAAASIAQVHRARLRVQDGLVDVVIKVQRPGVIPVVERDLDILARLADALERRAAWARGLGVVDLVRGFAVALREELDFRMEARNIATVAAASTRDSLGKVVMPVVYERLCTKRVLVLELLPGTPLGSAAAVLARRGHDRPALARDLLNCLLSQIMLSGVFHADPHPGNVLLLDDGRLGLLDFGSVGRLDSALRAGLQQLLLGIDRGDPAAVCDGLLEVVSRPDEINEARLERAVGQLIAKHFTSAGNAEVELFTDLFRLITHHGLAVPPEIAAVFRALATMEGTLGLLAPGFSVVDGSRAFVVGKMAEQFSIRSGGDALTGELLAMLPLIRRLPRRIDRISAAVEQGRMSVNVRLLADERDRKVVLGIVHLFALMFIGATTGIMAVLLLGTTGGPRVLDNITLYQVFGYNLMVISALIGLRLLFTIVRAQR